MKIAYPYNETLPKKTAHDVYLFRNCVSLGETGAFVHLLCGWGTPDETALDQHYQVQAPPSMCVQRLPILRRCGPLSCNRLFFWMAQRTIRELRPDVVLTSVFKQAEYHLARRCPGVCYVYELHQLSWYPNCDEPGPYRAALTERAILQQMDLVTVTTFALKEILLQPPYALTIPIEVVPLAVDVAPLIAPPRSPPLTVMYVGQLYQSQGVDLLIKALALVPDIELEIIGGTDQQIHQFKVMTYSLGIAQRVQFRGFVPPSQLSQFVHKAHAFVAPFYAVERMPYVAHTKLLEYASWGRPIIAPRLPVVQEHLSDKPYHLLFTAGDAASLAQSLQQLKNQDLTMMTHTPDHSWKERARNYRRVLEHLL